MEAPAVTASSPISGGSAHHRHSSSASTTADDEDGVSSKLVIDLDGYGDRRGSYSPSEYYCYSVCGATSAAEAMHLERACEGGGNATGPTPTTIATTSCAVSVGNGHGATTASLSESIESVVSAAAALASSPSSGSAGGGNVLATSESEDGATTGAHRRPIIAGPNRPSNGAGRVAGGGRSRASPSASRPAQSFSSSHDLDSSQKTSPTPGGAAIRRSPPTATATAASPASSRAGESCCSQNGGGTAAAASVSVRNGAGGGENSRFRQQNNRNVTSAVTLENTCTTNIGGIDNGGVAAALSSTSICVSLSPPIIATTTTTTAAAAATTTTTTSGKASLTVVNSTDPVVSNKPRRSAGSSSTKRSKTTNTNNNTSSTPASATTVSVSPSGITKGGLGHGMVNATNMASNTTAAAAATPSPSSDDQQNESNQQQNGSSVFAQRQQSTSASKTAPTLPRPSSLFKPKEPASPDGCSSPSGTQPLQADDCSTNAAAADAGLTLKIKRKKMATRQTAASHEVISDKQRKRENSDEASSSSSSSACASPAPATMVNRNSPLLAIAGEKKRKSSSSSASGIRAALANAGAPSSPASSISSTSSTSASSFYNHHQQQQHSSGSSSVLSSAGPVSTPSSPPSANTNRASPFVSAAASNVSVSTVTVLPTVSSPTAAVGLNIHMAASETISNSANVTGTASTAVGEKGNGKTNSKAAKHNLQQETGIMGTPPRKKSKLQNNQQGTATVANLNQVQQSSDHEQEPKCSTSTISSTVFTPVSDIPKAKVEQHDAGTWVRTVGTTTETDCLGPCEPGTSVTLEGIVWQETAGGILVINVTWRGKTYVGTLLDCTKYDWAPPRHCDSPHSENDSLTSGGGYGANGNSSGHRTPAKSGNGSGNGNGRGRKGGTNRESKRQQQQQQQQQLQQQVQQQQSTEATTAPSATNGSTSTDQETSSSGNDASTSNAQNGATGKETKAAVSETILEPHSPIMFECPLGGCEKKFAAVVGVKYHQSSAHRRAYDAAMKGHCQQTTKNNQNTTESATSPALIPEEPTRSLLEEAVAATTKLSPEERASLESLFKVAEQSGNQKGQPESGKPSTRAGSPAYSDISDDEGVPSAASEHPPSSATSTTTVLHSGHGVEKPTAIVEPQPLASTIVGVSADLTSSTSPSQQAIGQMGATGSALQETPRGQKRSNSGTSKSPRESKPSKERQPASAIVEPNTVRMTPPTSASLSMVSISPSTSRSPDSGPSMKSQSSVLIKAEPGSPRLPSSTAQDFVAPAPPPPVLQQQISTGLIPVPLHQPGQSQPSPAVAVRVPTPSSQLSLPSPASSVQPGPTPSQPSASVPAVSAPPSHHHLNMMNQLNHPAFMFNPFNAGSPMFPAGSMPPGVIPSTMGMDPTMAAAAAALMGGHPAAAMYAPPGSMAAAALAAAGFQMGLGGATPGPHPSVGYGFGPPPPSLAVSMAPGVLPPSFIPGTGPMPSSAPLIQPPPSSPATNSQSHLQQPLHKIHELTEHAKRSTPADSASTPVPAVPVPPSQTLSNGAGPGNGSPKIAPLGTGSTSATSGDSNNGTHAKHRSSASTPKPTASSSNVATSGSHQSGNGQHKSSSNGADGVGQSNRPSAPTSSAAPIATSELKSSSMPSVSPPVQRHLHTHHHTHTYPTLLAPAIDPSYAAIMATQQAAAGMVGGFPPFGTPSKS